MSKSFVEEHIFYAGTVDAYERARNEAELGYSNTQYLDTGNHPSLYSGWGIAGDSVIVRILESAPDDYIDALAKVLKAEGAVSILIFDRDGNYLHRDTPFGRMDAD